MYICVRMSICLYKEQYKNKNNPGGSHLQNIYFVLLYTLPPIAAFQITAVCPEINSQLELFI
jgi:hypothetical protein